MCLILQDGLKKIKTCSFEPVSTWQGPRGSKKPIHRLTNLDSVPLNVIVSKYFEERSSRQTKKQQTTLVNNLPWQTIFKPLISTIILLSIIVCFVNRSTYPNSWAFCCLWWKWVNVGQRETAASFPFCKAVVSSSSDKTMRFHRSVPCRRLEL